MQPTFHRFESGVFLPPLDEPIPTPGMRLPAILFCLTAATTFAAGVAGWQPLLFRFDDQLAQQFSEHWPRGLAYAIAVMAVLAAHEFGHFIAARLYRIPATLPFFIPVPVLLTGTLGAVIGMDGSRANRRQIFDIALAGPLAGLVVAVPLLAIGMLTGTPAPGPMDALNRTPRPGQRLHDRSQPALYGRLGWVTCHGLEHDSDQPT